MCGIAGRILNAPGRVGNDLVELMEEGERTAYPQVESIRLCTRISRTMEEILQIPSSE